MRVLLVDDAPFIRKTLELRLKKCGYVVVTAASAEEAITVFARDHADVVVLDYELPGMNGEEAMRQIHDLSPSVPVIFVSGHQDLELATGLMRKGAIDFVSKGSTDGSLEVAMVRAVSRVTEYRLIQNYKEAERQYMDDLVQRENHHHAVMAASIDPLLTVNAYGVVCFASNSVQDVLGWAPEDLVGQNVNVIIPEPHGSAHDGYVERFRKSGDSKILGVRRELEALRRDGTTFPCEVILDRVSIPGEDHFLFIGVIRDITDRRRSADKQRLHAAELEIINRKLRKAADEANVAALAKSDFLANMSHEIRTPLTAVLGFVDILKTQLDGGADGLSDCLETIDTIRSNGEHLALVINDVLDVSTLESGRLTLECRAVSVRDLIEQSIQLFRGEAQSKGIGLQVEFIGDIPHASLVDEKRLRQIVFNLLGNGVKFTDRGGVRLVVRHFLEGDQALFQFDFVDTGIGMSPFTAQELFKPFVQADHSMTRRFGGSGLGLVISKRLARLMGGDVEIVETNPGLGTRFRATIAVQPVDTPSILEASDDASIAPVVTEPKNSAAPLRDVRILVAEDVPANQRLVSFHLTKAGACVEVVDDGRQAVDRAIEFKEAGRAFDIILMDMQMPILDGYAATAELRERTYDGHIIALTAHALASDREKCIAAGCDEYLTKPIDKSALLSLLTRFVEPIEHAVCT